MNEQAPSIFVIGSPVTLEENRQVEFKEIRPGNKNPVKTIASKSSEYAVAFLNDIPSLGGSVYWGVRDNDRVVTAVYLNANERDELRKTVTSILDKIQPALTPNAYSIILHQVLSSNGDRVQDSFVVELSVKSHEYRNIYFAGGKRAYIKNDAGRKELSGLELVDEIKRRERIVSSSYDLWGISDYFHLFKKLRPLFFWIEKEVGKKDAPLFFGVLQILFNGNYSFFNKVNDSLLFGTDNLLRVLCSLPKFDEYSQGKFHIALGQFFQYLELEDSIKKDYEMYNLKEAIRSVEKQFRIHLKNSLSNTEEERLLVVLLLQLLEFLHDCVLKKQKMLIPQLSRGLTDSVFELIIPVVESNFNVKFPSRNDEFYSMIIRDIQTDCEEDWLLYKKNSYR